MNGYNPAYALLLFVVISLLVYLIFRPIKGWFWLVKNNYKPNEKTVIEDILKQLYHVENSGSELNIKNLAGVLEFNDKQIVDVVKKMTINNLLIFDADVLKLTETGRDYALRIVRVIDYGKDTWQKKRGLTKKNGTIEQS